MRGSSEVPTEPFGELLVGGRGRSGAVALAGVVEEGVAGVGVGHNLMSEAGLLER